MNLCDVQEIKELLSRHGFHFSKSMGQNFLIADWVPNQIVLESGIDNTCGVLEIGPGIGPLTVKLAAAAGRVAAVELDETLLPILDEVLGEYENVTVIPGDIMKLNPERILSEYLEGLNPVVCANLPYNITTPVLTKLLDCRCFSSITVMVQKEAAQRICAQVGMGDYGYFSLFCQYHAECSILFDVAPSCFLPPPKVTSAILQLVPRTTSLLSSEKEKVFFTIIRAAFAQRRKTLLNALFSAFGKRFSKEDLRDTLINCGFSADVRGEKLTLNDYLLLSSRLK